MNTVLPSRSARNRGGRWGASGLHLMRFARVHSGSAATRAAARSAPTKFGIRSVMGNGNRAAQRSRSIVQMRSRSACFTSWGR